MDTIQLGTSERALPQIEFDLFRALVEQSPEAIVYADRAGTVRLWNRGAEALFGYAQAEALGSSLDLIIPERFRRAHWDGFRKAIEGGRTRHGREVLTTRSMHKDGSSLYVDLSFALIRDRSGSVTGALAVGRDCSARYRAERALRARLAQLEASVAADRAAHAQPVGSG